MIIQYEKQIPVLDSYDVVVAGSGPAGICAAVAAARMGVKTALLERYGAVGGNLTLGLVGHTMGSVSKGTMADEINSVAGSGKKGLSQDFELAKIGLVKLIKDSGADLYLQAPVCDVVMEGNRIRSIIVSTHKGLRAIGAGIAVDATGDGNLAYLAGAGYEMGREQDGFMQPVTLMFKLGGVDDSVAISEGNHTYDVRMPGSGFNEMCKKASETGELPPMVSKVRLYRTSRKGECVVNSTQINFIDGTDVKDIAKAEYSLREQIPVIIRFLQNRVRGFENCFLQESAATLGVRETRRITGEYILHEDDLIAGKRFSDVVVHKAAGPIDIHNPTGAGMHEYLKVKPYDIPYRCLVPTGIDGLLTAGRCISGTHRAHASFRLMNICMATGEAAGTAAALSAKKNVNPRDLDVALIQSELTRRGVDLFG